MEDLTIADKEATIHTRIHTVVIKAIGHLSKGMEEDMEAADTVEVKETLTAITIKGIPTKATATRNLNRAIQTTTISTTINAMEVIVGWRRNQWTKRSKTKRKMLLKARRKLLRLCRTSE